jgi:hypothetical protein
MLAGDGSHSTDQASERAYGHGTGRAESSGGLPENKGYIARLSILILSKAYPFYGILSHVARL